MCRTSLPVCVCLTIALLVAPLAYAQKGIGDSRGVAQQGENPAVVSLLGNVLEVKTGPCESTTGRAETGTHFLLETADGQKLNIHLGPETAVADITEQLCEGKAVSVQAFRTDKMPESHFVAQSLSLDSRTFTLRDDGLRPIWSQGKAISPTQQRAEKGSPQPSLDQEKLRKQVDHLAKWFRTVFQHLKERTTELLEQMQQVKGSKSSDQEQSATG